MDSEKHLFARGEERWTSRALALVIFGCAFAYGVYRIGLGLDLGDEGLYLAAPLRYALGDLPFRDEFLNPLRMFDVVLWPLFWAAPELTLFELRLFWLVVQMGAAVALYSLLRRFAPGWLVALSCAATLYLSNLIWTPGYHLMGTFFFVLSWSLWLAAAVSKRGAVPVALGATSGAVFFAGAVSYVPLAALALIPVLVLARELWRGGRQQTQPAARVRATSAHLGSLLGCAVAAIAAVAVAGLAPDWLAAHRIMLTAANYSASPTEKLAGFARQVVPFLPLVLAAALLAVAAVVASGRGSRLSRLAEHPVGLGAVTLLSCAGLLFLAFELPLPDAAAGTRPNPFKEDSLRIVAIVLGLHLGVALTRRRLRGGAADRDADWRFVHSALLGGSLLLAFLHGLLGDMAWKSMFAVLPLFAVAICALHRRLANPRLAAAACAGACLAIGISSYAARWDWVFGEAPVHQLNTEFEHPRLAGIRSTPAKVESLEAVARYFEDRVAEGDRLLVNGHASLLYFLTRTRPALDHSWSNRQIPAEVRKRSLEKMVTLQRVPEYAVHAAIFAPKLDRLREKSRPEMPVEFFIRDHYRRQVRFGAFEIWRLRARGSHRRPSGN
jgi:hypothetical protein